jgi:hypothetical protein
VVIPDEVLRRQQEQERRKLEQSLADERAKLEREQERELRSPPPGTQVDKIRERHVAEKQAFEGHAAEQRQVLEQRIQKKIARPNRVKDVGKQRGKSKGKDRGERDEG